MTTKKAKPNGSPNGTAPTEAAETVLDAKALLDEAPRLPVQAVPVPELNGRVHVREMTVGERDEYEARVVDARQENRPSGLVRAALLVRVLCDADGQCLFAADQTEALGARVGDRLFEVACRLNGIGQKQVEEREKN